MPFTVSITANKSIVNKSETAIIYFTMGSLVTDFTLELVEVTNGTLSDLASAGTFDYTATFTPTPHVAGMAKFNLQANLLSGLGSEVNAAAEELIITVYTMNTKRLMTGVSVQTISVDADDTFEIEDPYCVDLTSECPEVPATNLPIYDKGDASAPYSSSLLDTAKYKVTPSFLLKHQAEEYYYIAEYLGQPAVFIDGIGDGTEMTGIDDYNKLVKITYVSGSTEDLEVLTKDEDIPAGYQTKEFIYNFIANRENFNLQWSLDPLIDGVTMSQSGTLTIPLYPTRQVSYDVTVRVLDPDTDDETTKDFTIYLSHANYLPPAEGVLRLQCPDTLTIKPHHGFNFKVDALGGTPPYTFAVKNSISTTLTPTSLFKNLMNNFSFPNDGTKSTRTHQSYPSCFILSMPTAPLPQHWGYPNTGWLSNYKYMYKWPTALTTKDFFYGSYSKMYAYKDPAVNSGGFYKYYSDWYSTYYNQYTTTNNHVFNGQNLWALGLSDSAGSVNNPTIDPWNSKVLFEVPAGTTASADLLNTPGLIGDLQRVTGDYIFTVTDYLGATASKTVTLTPPDRDMSDSCGVSHWKMERKLTRVGGNIIGILNATVAPKRFITIKSIVMGNRGSGYGDMTTSGTCISPPSAIIHIKQGDYYYPTYIYYQCIGFEQSTQDKITGAFTATLGCDGSGSGFTYLGGYSLPYYEGETSLPPTIDFTKPGGSGTQATATVTYEISESSTEMYITTSSLGNADSINDSLASDVVMRYPAARSSTAITYPTGNYNWFYSSGYWYTGSEFTNYNRTSIYFPHKKISTPFSVYPNFPMSIHSFGSGKGYYYTERPLSMSLNYRKS